YKDEIIMAPTLEEALSQVIKKSDGITENLTIEPSDVPEEIVPEDVPDITDYINNIISSYDAFRKSSSSNDWQQMGKDLDNLDKAINKVR
ncbi:MAG: hypothetical protein J6R66_00215, partial [Clostridia bacterium]|nr:hypothetical protein [Clostridia bacterium]